MLPMSSAVPISQPCTLLPGHTLHSCPWSLSPPAFWPCSYLLCTTDSANSSPSALCPLNTDPLLPLPPALMQSPMKLSQGNYMKFPSSTVVAKIERVEWVVGVGTPKHALLQQLAMAHKRERALRAEHIPNGLAA